MIKNEKDNKDLKEFKEFFCHSVPLRFSLIKEAEIDFHRLKIVKSAPGAMKSIQ